MPSDPLDRSALEGPRAVILAGGEGTRLRPYSTFVPKPLLPIRGERPILEIVLRQLARAGFARATLAVNHGADAIAALCADGGARLGLRVDLSREREPLGTVGPLTLIPDLPPDFLVMNADVLCDLDFRGLLEEHVRAGNDVTVATCRRRHTAEYGVLRYDDAGGRVTGFVEKPVHEMDVSMGVYCLKREQVERLAKGVRYGFDDLMVDGLRRGDRIVARPFAGLWLHISRPADYEAANDDFERYRARVGL